MKKLSYYAASFAVCCMMSAAFTSCVDETEEPDYVKQVREAEMKAEIAAKQKQAKDSAKASEAAFTTASLNGLEAGDVYEAYEICKAVAENANEILAKATSNLDLFYESVENQKVQIQNLKDDLKNAQESQISLSSTATDLEKVKAQAAVDKADQELKDYENNKFPTVKLSEVYSDPVSLFGAYESDPKDWKSLYGNYLFCKEQAEKWQAKFTEIENIYNEFISAEMNANN